MAVKNIYSFIKKKMIDIFLYKNYMSYIKYFTFAKLFNVLLNKLEYKQKKIKLKSFPISYCIDIGNVCNLKCPLCPTGTDCPARKKQFMNFETYKKIFDKVKKYAFVVNLYNWGEPFLNKDIFKIVDYTKKNNVGVYLSTNFNTVTDDMIHLIVKSKIDKMVFSIDGANQESYSSYRRNGNYDIVIENIRKLLEEKKKQKSNYPRMVWQYLINKKNERFIDDAKRLAAELGISITFLYTRISQLIIKKGDKIDNTLIQEWLPDRFRNNTSYYLSTINTKGPCNYPFQHLYVNPEGTTSPCCAIYDEKTDFGDLLKNDLKDVWNNDNYLSARSLFSRNKSLSSRHTICNECLSVRK